jgi:hypothetical protein
MHSMWLGVSPSSRRWLAVRHASGPSMPAAATATVPFLRKLPPSSDDTPDRIGRVETRVGTEGRVQGSM